MILNGPGHRSRDSGTERADCSGVDLGFSGRTRRLTLAWRPTLAEWSWAAVAFTVVLSVFMAVLGIMGRDPLVLLLFPQALTFGCIGAVVLARRPGHPMGPLLCLIGLTDVLAQLPFGYARYTIVHSPGSLPLGDLALWANTWAFAPATSVLGLVLPLVFPDGKLLSPRWRPALYAALAFVPLAIAGYAFIPQTMGPLFGNRPSPFAIYGYNRLFEAFQVLAVACGLAVALAAVVSMTLRWRQADEVRRQQLKWFLAVLPVTVVAITVTLVFPGPVSLGIGLVAGILQPAAVGVAVLRYRLYEIDVLLNRAVRYFLLSVGVAAVYLGVILVAQAVLGVHQQSLAVQVVATVVAAAVLFPLRDRVQRRVDRLFYGDRGAPYEALARLGRRVEEATDTETALQSVVRTIADSLRLPYAALELRLGDGWSPAAAYGSLPPGVVEFPLTSQHETVGRLLVGPRRPGEQLSPDDERLLADLARQAGPATHAVALRRALDASRMAQVSAREEERRRIRRDLHDGLGPTLAGLTLGLDTARTRCVDQPDLESLLDRLKKEMQQTVTDVRRIVYGLRPPALDQFGLAGSLREEVGRLRSADPAVVVTLDTPGDGLDDLPAAVEVACYRIVTEALTNVVRHARAKHCSVRLGLAHGLEVGIRDDGVGLPEGWRAGVGITSMRERVTELGGELIIATLVPHGTAITARLPLQEQP
jgi:two-component system, NarL family, sensor kinase